MTDTKPCPFCRSDDVFVYECEDTSAGCSTFWTECESCGARGPISEYKDGATIHWNAAAAELIEGAWQPMSSEPNDGKFRFYGLHVMNSDAGFVLFEAHYLAHTKTGQLIDVNGDATDWAFNTFEVWMDVPTPPTPHMDEDQKVTDALCPTCKKLEMKGDEDHAECPKCGWHFRNSRGQWQRITASVDDKGTDNG